MLIRLLWILPALALITLVAVPSNADCQPGHGQAPYDEIITPVLIDPEPIHAVERPAVIVQPVLTPAFSFQFLGSYDAGAAPTVSPTGSIPAGGSTIGASPVPSAPTPAPATVPATPPPGRTLSDADIAALARALGRHRAAEVVEDDGPPVDPSASHGITATPAAASGAPQAASSMDPILLAAFRQSCTECHAAAVHRGGVTLFDSAGSFAPSRHGQPLSRETIRQAITSGTMPPDGRSFDPQALARLGSWTSQP